VKTAFLYGGIEKTMHMEQLGGFADDKSKVCLLKKYFDYKSLLWVWSWVSFKDHVDIYFSQFEEERKKIERTSFASEVGSIMQYDMVYIAGWT
jgi:hypothetical protein